MRVLERSLERRLERSIHANSGVVFNPSLVNLSDVQGNTPEANIRNSTATAFDYLGVLKTIPINSHRLNYGRGVENLITFSEDIVTGGWGVNGGATLVDSNTVGFTPNASEAHYGSILPSAGDYILSYDVWVDAGTHSVYPFIWNSTNGGINGANVLATTQVQRVRLRATALVGGLNFLYIQNALVNGSYQAGNVHISNISLVNVTGHLAGYTPEYVPRLTAATALKWFDDDGSGNPLHPSHTFKGTKRYRSFMPYATAKVVAAGGHRFEGGRYYQTLTGGTTNGATLLADVGITDWADKGIYNAGFGVLVEGIATNIYPSPTVVATQTISIALGDHALSCLGTGSLALTAGTAVISATGTATEGSPVMFTCTTAGTVISTLAGALTNAQLEANTIASSFTTSSRANEMGNIKWKSSFFNHVTGTAGFTIKPQFASGDLVLANSVIAGLNTNIVDTLLGNEITSSVNIRSKDATNDLIGALTAYSYNAALEIFVRWGIGADSANPSQQRLVLTSRNANKGESFVSVSSPYDGAFTDTGFYQWLMLNGLNNTILLNNPIWDKPLTDADLDSLVEL